MSQTTPIDSTEYMTEKNYKKYQQYKEGKLNDYQVVEFFNQVIKDQDYYCLEEHEIEMLELLSKLGVLIPLEDYEEEQQRLPALSLNEPNIDDIPPVDYDDEEWICKGNDTCNCYSCKTYGKKVNDGKRVGFE